MCMTSLLRMVALPYISSEKIQNEDTNEELYNLLTPN